MLGEAGCNEQPNFGVLWNNSPYPIHQEIIFHEKARCRPNQSHSTLPTAVC